jgi:hypothetical protein
LQKEKDAGFDICNVISSFSLKDKFCDSQPFGDLYIFLFLLL